MGRRVHLVGICGTGMGSLAGLFRAAGWEVQGSDAGVYPPMSDRLAALGIPVMSGFTAGHLDWQPDLVVIGNIARPDNPEAVEARRRGLPATSMAAALADHFLSGRHPLVVTGTHGKTTTASILAWGLQAAGRDPGFLIGGVLANLETTFRLGGGEPFVIEGDEYESAFFDKGPKFLHYRPQTAVLTSIELDHIEVFPDLDVLKEAFRRFVDLLPIDGRLVAWSDDPDVEEIAASCRAPVTRYGLGEGPGTRCHLVDAGREGSEFDLVRDGGLWGRFRTLLTGDHNLCNFTAAAEVMAGRGLGPEEVATGLASFAGVRRRQEVRGEVGGVTVIDDFAHHPTAVRETLRALKVRYPGRRLVAVFEPRTNTSRRALFQSAYADSLSVADRVVVAAVHQPERAPEGDRLDAARLAAQLRDGGTPASYLPHVEEILADLSDSSQADDVVAIMSNGAFGGLHERLLDALRKRNARSPLPSPEPESGPAPAP
jgi:UDP-N-acetylmuramate: L-alanyl-gamma-D-glutamyl-meso-diaminopimelate ligase